MNALLFAAASAQPAENTTLEDYVNPLMGAWSTGDLSNGNTLPLVGEPWGFNNFSVFNKNNEETSWWIDPNTRYLDGVRLTHQPSPWIGDWGQFFFSWMRDPASRHDSVQQDTASFKPSEISVDVTSEGTTQGPTNVRVTGSKHGGIVRFDYQPPAEGEFFPYRRNAHLFLPAWVRPQSCPEVPYHPANPWDNKLHDRMRFYRSHHNATFNRDGDKGKTAPIDGGKSSAADWTNGFIEDCVFTTSADRLSVEFECINRNGNGTGFSSNPFVMFMYGKLVSDVPFEESSAPGNDGNTLNVSKVQTGSDGFSYLKCQAGELEPDMKDPIVGYTFYYPETVTFNEFRLATSLISMDQAKSNYAQEVEGKTYEQMQSETADKWNEVLGAVQLEEHGAEPTEEEGFEKFYSNVYRAALFPRDLSEEVETSAGSGVFERKHVSPVASCRHEAEFDTANCSSIDAAVAPALYDGPFSTDSGFWDAYHTVYGLQSLLWPERYVDTVEGYINHYRENYWIAQWGSPGYKSSMVGTMSDNIIADAMVKGLVAHSSWDDAWAAVTSNLQPREVPSTDRPPQDCEGSLKGSIQCATNLADVHSMCAALDGTALSAPMCKDDLAANAGWVAAACLKGAIPTCDRSGEAFCDYYPTLGWNPDDRCGKYGREGMQEYDAMNYLPSDVGVDEDLARTMNYWNSDAAILNAGLVTGKLLETDPLAIKLTERIAAGPNAVFDPITKFMRPRKEDGSFGEGGTDNIWAVDELGNHPEWGFDEYAWGKHYTEGGPWHYRFALMHDIPKLVELYGDELCHLMGSIHEQPGIVHHMGYWTTIHEMAEMPGNAWGQYLQNNQPGHPHLWIQLAVARATGDAECEQNAMYYIKKVLTELYKSDGYAGDEDNGEMAAWYVLSSLGMYDLFPGSGEFVAGSPLVQSATIQANYPVPRADPSAEPITFAAAEWKVQSSCSMCVDVDYDATSGLNASGALPYGVITGAAPLDPAFPDAVWGGVVVDSKDTTTTTTTAAFDMSAMDDINSELADTKAAIDSLMAMVTAGMCFALFAMLTSFVVIFCLKGVKKNTKCLKNAETVYVDN